MRILFSELLDFDRIWVVGPQRSGTRAATQMIAADCGHRMLDEQDFSVDSISHLYARLALHKDAGLCIQAPGLTRWVHHLAGPEDAVVFMWRADEDIHASEQRINWQYDQAEAIKYGATKGSAELKKRFWAYQQTRLAHPFTLDYELLSQHRLWVPKAERARFLWNQTTPGKLPS